jgi:hypothetical protein
MWLAEYREDVTSDFLYLRLHGESELYTSGYTGGSAGPLGRPHPALGGRRGAGGCAAHFADALALARLARRVLLLRQRREGAGTIRRTTAHAEARAVRWPITAGSPRDYVGVLCTFRGA